MSQYGIDEKLRRLAARRDPDGIEAARLAEKGDRRVPPRPSEWTDIYRNIGKAGDGSRGSPIHVQSPADMAAAARRVEQPSPAAARAGNYRMAHVMVGCLPVSIETPMGGIRSGVGADGTPWSVRMPVDYGYVKQSTGADGDHVDVYVGPQAHAAEMHPVYVVDQRDADSCRFDEHKAMLGFSTAAAAREAYLAAFSDGRGGERVGAVTRMSWQAFVEWLGSGDCAEPLKYKTVGKSAWDASAYGGSVPSCNCGGTCRSCASRGGYMTTTAVVTDATPSPKLLGRLSAMLAKAWPHMTPAERTDFVADAAATSGAELGKAHELLERGEEHQRVGRVEDLWDGPPDNELRMVRRHGPGSSSASGVVPVGPSQDASGDGAIKMEREYSRWATQSGVEEATNRLGRELSKMRQVMKSLVGFGDSMSTRMAAMETAQGSLLAPATLEAFKIDPGEIAKAVAAAMPALLRQAVTIIIKARENEEEEDEEKEEDGDEPVSKAETAEEMKEEKDEEGESDEHRKEAAKARVLARNQLAKARRALRKAEEHEGEKEKEKAEKEKKAARNHLEKARIQLAVSKALRNAKDGPSTVAIAKAIKSAAKDMPKPQAENQTVFPASKTQEVGKSGEGAPDLAALMAQMGTIQKAVDGFGMLVTDTRGLVDALARQPDPNGDRLPPVFALAKAKPADLNTIEAQVGEMVTNNVISIDDADRTRDVIGRARMGMHVDAMVQALPEPVQKLIQSKLAA